MLKGQTAEVSVVAWCPNDMTKIVTLNDAGSFWIWRVDEYSIREQNDDVTLHVVGQAERKVVRKFLGLFLCLATIIGCKGARLSSGDGFGASSTGSLAC